LWAHKESVYDRRYRDVSVSVSEPSWSGPAATSLHDSGIRAARTAFRAVAPSLEDEDSIGTCLHGSSLASESK
ncbi:hypothetical protein AMECASPLE_012398, partial [Ameca splendens]